MKVYNMFGTRLLSTITHDFAWQRRFFSNHSSPDKKPHTSLISEKKLQTMAKAFKEAFQEAEKKISKNPDAFIYDYIGKTEASNFTDPQRTILLLGNSNIGYRIAQEGKRRGYRVIITSRQIYPNQNHIEFIHTPQSVLKDKKFWEELPSKYLQGTQNLTVVNSIGGSDPNSGESIHDLNVKIPLAAIEGISKGVGYGKSIQQYNVVQLSTIVAGRVEAPYGKTKRETELRLMDLPLKHLTMLRMGHVVEPLIEGQVTQIIKSQHHLFAEEMALLPLFPLIGNPAHYNKILMQTVSIDDVVKGTFNTCNQKPSVEVIDAVSREVITQEQFFQFFSHLLGKKFRPIYMPIEAAKKLVKHHAYGHFASYVVEYCEMNGMVLDPQKFEKLVGSPLRSLVDMHELEAGQELLVPRPPVAKYVLKVLKNVLSSSECALDTLTALKIWALSLMKNRLKVDSNYSVNPLKVQSNIIYKTTNERKFNQNSEQNRK